MDQTEFEVGDLVYCARAMQEGSEPGIQVIGRLTHVSGSHGWCTIHFGLLPLGVAVAWLNQCSKIDPKRLQFWVGYYGLPEGCYLHDTRSLTES